MKPKDQFAMPESLMLSIGDTKTKFLLALATTPLLFRSRVAK